MESEHGDQRENRQSARQTRRFVRRTTDVTAITSARDCTYRRKNGAGQYSYEQQR